MTNHTAEYVVVVYRDRLDGIEGFLPTNDFNHLKVERDLCFGYVERAAAEVSDWLVQVIAGAVLALPTGEHIGFRRRKGGRSDLDSRLTLTVGGHVGPEEIETNITASLRSAVIRELREEFVPPFPAVLGIKPLGVIIDRSDELASSRHACFLFGAEVAEIPQPDAPEEFDMNVASVLIDDLKAHSDYDPWGAIYANASGTCDSRQFHK